MNTRLQRNRILSILAVALVAVSAAALADDDKFVNRPFRAEFHAVNVIVPDLDGSLGCNPGDLFVDIDAAGWARYMDVVTDRQSHCLNPQTGEAYNGLWEFTNPDGDTLFGTYVPTLRPTVCSEPPTECPVFLVIGRYTIDGGTGKYANVVPGGGGDARGLQNLATGQASISLGGFIRLAKKD